MCLAMYVGPSVCSCVCLFVSVCEHAVLMQSDVRGVERSALTAPICVSDAASQREGHELQSGPRMWQPLWLTFSVHVQ